MARRIAEGLDVLLLKGHGSPMLGLHMAAVFCSKSLFWRVIEPQKSTIPAFVGTGFC